MTFPAGTRFGVYELTGLIGAGGMGEVYRATDTKLGREVAIKTLPSELALDRDRLARFEREAKLLAALNHPHIAAVYGLHEHEGTQFLAMELIEGETLERELRRGPMPLEDALRLALQIAEALEAAHEKGVVHRDLKPANVMVTRGGQIKVLDFGLAKALASDPNRTTLGQSPASSLAMTQAGLLLGTAGYMSPEQASGQSIDQRADTWAFGVVLYEMLTGAPLFSGESVPHVLAGVLKTEPDWSRLPKNLHPRLRLLLERCLTKKPRNRLQAIADARIEIEAVLADPKGLTRGDEGAVPNKARTLRAASIVGAVAVVVGLIGGWYLRPLPVPSPSPVVRFSAPLPADQSFTGGPFTAIAISRDGTRIAYPANQRIYVRELSQPAARPVPGTETTLAAVTPTFSPDGQWLAYIEAVTTTGPWLLRRVPISGGAPVTIHQAQGPQGLQLGLMWPTADTILFTNEQGVVRIPSNGGAAEVLVARGANEWLYSPQLLPGNAVLFTRVAGAPGDADALAAAQVVVQSIGANDRRIVWEGGSAARYVPSGHLVYAQGTALFAIAFDPNARSVRGGAVSMAEGLRRAPNGGDAANFSLSDNGTLVTIPPDPALAVGGRIESTLAWVDRDGRETQLPIRADDYTSVRISPDGTKIALVVSSRLARPTPPAIWLFDQRTENLSLLTAGALGDDTPLWSSDSRRVFYRSFRGETSAVFAIDVESRETTMVGTSADHPFALPWTITRDDQVIGLVSPLSLEDFNIATLSVADGTYRWLLNEKPNESEPSISPNGAWIAYAGAFQDPSSQMDLRPFPAVSQTRVPLGPGRSPVFSRDGSELFYFDGSGLSAVPISYDPRLRVDSPRRLFQSEAYQWHVDGRAWDVDPSGQRFLMIRLPSAEDPDTPRPSQQIDVVVNWFAELNARVPTF